MSGFENLDANKFILALRDDVTMQSFFPNGKVILNSDFAPREPPTIYITFNMTASSDVNTMGGFRAFTKPSYLIEVVGREVGFDILRPIAERFDELLTSPDTSRLIGTTYIARFIRTNAMQRSDSLDNIRWNYLGGVYETMAYTYNV